MVDAYGIPGNMFGPVSDDFYAAIGRVTMVASILDMRLLELLWALGDEPQHVHAGRATADLIKRSNRRLTRLADGSTEDGLALVEETTTLLKERNALVHSVWPETRLEGARGWRYGHPSQRNGGEVPSTEPVIWTQATAESLRRLVGSMVDLSDRLARFTQHLHAGRARRIAAGPVEPGL
jgi:hypothetical protein